MFDLIQCFYYLSRLIEINRFTGDYDTHRTRRSENRYQSRSRDRSPREYRSPPRDRSPRYDRTSRRDYYRRNRRSDSERSYRDERYGHYGRDPSRSHSADTNYDTIEDKSTDPKDGPSQDKRTKSPSRQAVETEKDTPAAGDDKQESDDKVNSPTSKDLIDENKLSAEELEVIGERINPDRALAPEANLDLVVRIQEIIKKGLPAEEKKALVKKFQPPKNCLFLDPPKLNAEVRAALKETQMAVIKIDQRIIETQQMITAGLGGLMKLASLALTLDKEKKLEILGTVSSLLRIFSDLQFEESAIRRNLILKNIDVSLRDTLNSTEVDEWLFGADLENQLKAAKALATSSGVLKGKRQSAQSYQAKNFKGPSRRQAIKR